MAVADRQIERFRVLNGLGDKDRVRPGDLVRWWWSNRSAVDACCPSPLHPLKTIFIQNANACLDRGRLPNEPF